MIFSYRYCAGSLAFLMDKAGGDGGGSGGSGGGDGKSGGGDGKGAGGNSDHAKTIEALQSQNKALEDRLAKLEKGPDKEKDDPDLQEKAKQARETKEKSEAGTKAIESALKFSLSAKDWLKTNSSLLPKDIEGIFSAAEKEHYDSAIEKDGAIKASVVQSFFSVQSNLDLLTPSQKTILEDFLKLTKNGKQEKSQGIYDQIFEPTFEMLKRVKKAEQLSKQGHATGTDGENDYKNRMMKLSKKHYLGEKDA